MGGGGGRGGCEGQGSGLVCLLLARTEGFPVVGWGWTGGGCHISCVGPPREGRSYPQPPCITLGDRRCIIHR
jgi:hypothetical protein